MFDRLRLLIQLTHAHNIARRYFVTNGFDGALTMLGLTMGFYSSGGVPTQIAINACLGAAVALAVSGLASAYVSETAEREKELRELEQALVTDLRKSAHGRAAQLVPMLIAAVNGLAPLVIALFIISPFWAEQANVALPIPPLELSIILAFVTLFFLGIFLGTVSGRFWLWAGLRTLLIAFLTAGIVFWISG